MPPKKKLSKNDEDRFELVRLRYHVEDSEKKLSEQSKTIQHLRDLHSHKTDEFESLQTDADRLAGDYQRNLEYMEEELTTKEEQLTHQVSVLKLELLRVTNELDCCRTFEQENCQLKQSVRELREELDQKEVRHADELFRQKKEAYKQQGNMEQELQRMVSEMGDRYRKEAFDSLAEESKAAIVQQGQMELKFLKQDETVNTLNERMAHLDHANQQLKIELDLTSDNFQTQTVRAQKQKRELREVMDKKISLERDARVSTMEIQNMKNQSSEIEVQTVEKKLTWLCQRLRNENFELNKMMKKCERKASKWKARALDIAKLAASPSNDQAHEIHGTFRRESQNVELYEDSDEGPASEHEETENAGFAIA
eukprot:TRINITY_DN10395_c0_g1_i4.p1 TRINITY_DN10395_c0_g1~~TRINITY_DN10395_c0_g1_i4.p1  ORF type:complete len:368 (+),score=100.27 TRINITY_DN10395_c0_g1_i4:197-1300(+)